MFLCPSVTISGSTDSRRFAAGRVYNAGLQAIFCVDHHCCCCTGSRSQRSSFLALDSKAAHSAIEASALRRSDCLRRSATTSTPPLSCNGNSACNPQRLFPGCLLVPGMASISHFQYRRACRNCKSKKVKMMPNFMDRERSGKYLYLN